MEAHDSAPPRRDLESHWEGMYYVPGTPDLSPARKARYLLLVLLVRRLHQDPGASANAFYLLTTHCTVT